MGTYSSSLPFAKEKGMHPGSSGADAKLGIESAKDSPGILKKKDASVSMYTQPDRDTTRRRRSGIDRCGRDDRDRDHWIGIQRGKGDRRKDGDARSASFYRKTAENRRGRGRF
ncbi:hypothetical protein KSP40_PGU014252 [Platanthera guangdongensis]|uniref:Uncharacterized protein n=1 Tax=Platanthera guangdongensis TaxID=2320717 RepID=A0ABR2MZV3_9ASPA